MLIRISAAALLAVSLIDAQVEDGRPTSIRALLVGGANNHDGAWTHRSLAEILTESGRFAVTITETPATALADRDSLATYDVLVLDYNGPRWGEPAESNFVAAVRGGTGVVVIHAANNAFPGWAEYEEMVALLWREGTGHGRFHPFDVTVIDHDHPITRGMPDLTAHPDELYHRLVNPSGAEFRLLAHAHSGEASGGTGDFQPMVLVREFGAGRVFHTPLGHVWKNVPLSRASHRDPQFRRLVARGTEWAATGGGGGNGGAGGEGGAGGNAATAAGDGGIDGRGGDGGPALNSGYGTGNGGPGGSGGTPGIGKPNDVAGAPGSDGDTGEGVCTAPPVD